MPFSYYKRLSARQKRIYDRSVAVPNLRLHAAGRLAPLVASVSCELQRGDRAGTERAAGQLTNAILHALNVPAVRVRVLAARPSRSWGELHGLYEPRAAGPPLVTVWMRTAQRRQVVAFKTFLRTLLHEIVHHLDYEFLELEDSLHTEGFYKRESSLFHQLVPEPEIFDKAARSDATPAAPPDVARSRRGRGGASAAPSTAGVKSGGARRRRLGEQTQLPFGET